MMKVIFECETEIGKCESETIWPGVDSRDCATVLARCQASVNGQKGILKVEHHCYLRRGQEVPEQPWIRPEIILEPALDSQAGMIALARSTHERFVERVRTQFPAQLLQTGK